MDWPGPVTHRQYAAWTEWDAIEESRPSRADWYAMQTACEVRRVLAKRPGSIKLEHFRLRFEDPLVPDGDEDADLEALSLRSQMGWFAMMTRPIRVVQADAVIASADADAMVMADNAPAATVRKPPLPPAGGSKQTKYHGDFSGGGMWDAPDDPGGGR